MSDAVNARLATRSLSVGYGSEPVVEGLDLTIPEGQFTALLGPNGSGKSTVLKSLARLLLPAAGEVLLDGANLRAKGAKAVARDVGLLAQGAVAPEGLRVIELVRQGRYPHRGLFDNWRAEDEEAVAEALRLTETAHLAERGIETLSGGQRQRVWTAMVLAQTAPILLLDEPTTYLDLAHQLDLLSLMRRLVDTRGLTVVAVLHDLNQAARFCDDLVFLKSGRLVEKGPVPDVFRADLIEAVFGVSVSILSDPESGRPMCVPRMTR
ncbi:MAG: ABC transporter ATP-binding protein [Pseudomonadota bacterium]|nr:ABC transporter ATP-binding protein [Pseudomonadota bacterium]